MFLQIQKFLLLVIFVTFIVGAGKVLKSLENNQQLGTVPYLDLIAIFLFVTIAVIAMSRGWDIEAMENENEDNESSQEDEAPP